MRSVEDINNYSVSGNLTRDAELKYSNSGLAVCNFTIASNKNKKQGDEWVEHTNFIDCTIFANKAESISQYLTKGKKLFIEGQFEQQRWEDKDGNKRQKLVLMPAKIVFGGGGERTSSAPQKAADTDSSDDFEDDVPF